MPFLSVCRKTPGLIRGRKPLIFNPALTTCASERMKTQRFSYFADFAARERMREAKPVKLKKVAFSHFFDTLRNGFAVPLIMRVIYLRIALGLPRISAYITARLQASRSAAERKGRETGSSGERGRAPAASAPE